MKCLGTWETSFYFIKNTSKGIFLPNIQLMCTHLIPGLHPTTQCSWLSLLIQLTLILRNLMCLFVYPTYRVFHIPKRMCVYNIEQHSLVSQFPGAHTSNNFTDLFLETISSYGGLKNLVWITNDNESSNKTMAKAIGTALCGPFKAEHIAMCSTRPESRKRV